MWRCCQSLQQHQHTKQQAAMRCRLPPPTQMALAAVLLVTATLFSAAPLISSAEAHLINIPEDLQYKFFAVPEATFDDANAACVAHEGTLTSIVSTQENLEINRIRAADTSGHSEFWIGLRNIGCDFEFLDGTPYRPDVHEQFLLNEVDPVTCSFSTKVYDLAMVRGGRWAHIDNRTDTVLAGMCKRNLVCLPSKEYQDTDNHVCRRISRCALDQFLLQEATWSSDVACKNVSTCHPTTEYEAAAPTATSDRECRPTTECGEGTYITAHPTPTTDRECARVSPCRPTEFAVAQPTATTDRVCMATRICTPGLFEAQSPTATTDRVCVAKNTTCDPDSFRNTSTNTCELLTTCQLGATFEVLAPQPTMDRECAPVSQCGDGQYETNAPTLLSDRTCANISMCGDGMYMVVPATPTSDVVCHSNTACRANEYEATSPTPTSDRSCREYDEVPEFRGADGALLLNLYDYLVFVDGGHLDLGPFHTLAESIMQLGPSGFAVGDVIARYRIGYLDNGKPPLVLITWARAVQALVDYAASGGREGAEWIDTSALELRPTANNGRDNMLEYELVYVKRVQRLHDADIRALVVNIDAINVYSPVCRPDKDTFFNEPCRSNVTTLFYLDTFKGCIPHINRVVLPGEVTKIEWDVPQPTIVGNPLLFQTVEIIPLMAEPGADPDNRLFSQGVYDVVYGIEPQALTRNVECRIRITVALGEFVEINGVAADVISTSPYAENAYLLDNSGTHDVAIADSIRVPANFRLSVGLQLAAPKGRRIHVTVPPIGEVVVRFQVGYCSDNNETITVGAAAPQITFDGLDEDVAQPIISIDSASGLSQNGRCYNLFAETAPITADIEFDRVSLLLVSKDLTTVTHPVAKLVDVLDIDGASVYSAGHRAKFFEHLLASYSTALPQPWSRITATLTIPPPDQDLHGQVFESFQGNNNFAAAADGLTTRESSTDDDATATTTTTTTTTTATTTSLPAPYDPSTPFLTLDDNVPPIFISCPSDISIVLPDNATSAVVSWEEPQAYDNIAIARIASNTKPGSAFSLLDSPHRVVVTAWDTSDLTATCSFLVNVAVNPRTTATTIPLKYAAFNSRSGWKLQNGGIVESAEVDFIDMTQLRDHQLLWSKPTAHGVDANEYKLRIQPNNGDRFSITYRGLDTQARLVVDMLLVDNVTLRTPHNHTSHAAWPDAYTRVTIVDPRDLNGEAVEQKLHWFTSSTETSIVLQPDDPTTPTHLRFAGEGSLPAVDFTFEAIEVSLHWPHAPLAVEIANASARVSTPASLAPPPATTPHGPATTTTTTTTTITTTAAATAATANVSSTVDDSANNTATHHNATATTTGPPPLPTGAAVSADEPVWTHIMPFSIHVNSALQMNYAFTDPVDMRVVRTQRHHIFGIADSAPPSFGDSCPSDIVVDAAPGTAEQRVWWKEPVAMDKYGIIAVTASHTPGSVFSMLLAQFSTSDAVAKSKDEEARHGYHTVTYTAMDTHGLTATCSFTVTVRDVEPPTITCPSDHVYVAGLGTNTVAITPDVTRPPTISDNALTACESTLSKAGLDPSPCLTTSTPSPEYGVGSHVITLSAWDASGNVGMCTFTIVVRDEEPPTISNCPTLQPDILTTNDTARVMWDDVGATDNDVLLRVSSIPAKGTRLSIGTHPVVVEAEDVSGNVARCRFNVTIVNVGASSSNGDQDTTTTADKIGIGVGVSLGVLLVLSLAAAVIVLYRRSRAKPHDFSDMLEDMHLQCMDSATNDQPVKPMELKRSTVFTLEELGKGNFGIVFKGCVRDGVRPEYLVAIKQLHESAGAVARQELLQECAIMAQFNHPHVVRLIGVVTAGEPMLAVLEYCEHGSLKHYLKSKDISLAERYCMAADCAEGLTYLTSRGYVHRDIAARNVLVNSLLHCKISDFGLSREKGPESDAYYQGRGGPLPVRWCAVEALEDRRFTTASDCWSYGILLYEIWTNAETPYSNWNNQRVWAEVTGGYRLPQPEDCVDEVYNLMLKCWDVSPLQRPSFLDMAVVFHRLYQATTAEVGNGSINDNAANNTGSANAERGQGDNNSTTYDGSIDKRLPPQLRKMPDLKQYCKGQYTLERTVASRLYNAGRHGSPRSSRPTSPQTSRRRRNDNDYEGSARRSGSGSGSGRRVNRASHRASAISVDTDATAWDDTYQYSSYSEYGDYSGSIYRKPRHSENAYGGSIYGGVPRTIPEEGSEVLSIVPPSELETGEALELQDIVVNPEGPFTQGRGDDYGGVDDGDDTRGGGSSGLKQTGRHLAEHTPAIQPHQHQHQHQHQQPQSHDTSARSSNTVGSRELDHDEDDDGCGVDSAGVELSRLDLSFTLAGSSSPHLQQQQHHHHHRHAGSTAHSTQTTVFGKGAARSTMQGVPAPAVNMRPEQSASPPRSSTPEKMDVPTDLTLRISNLSRFTSQV